MSNTEFDTTTIRVEGTKRVFMAKPNDSTLTLPTPGLNGSFGESMILSADLSVGGDYRIEIGNYDPTLSAGNRFVVEEIVATIQSDGPTYGASINKRIPEGKAVNVSAPGAGFPGHVRIRGKLVEMTL